MGNATMEERPILEEIADLPQPTEVMRIDVETVYKTKGITPYNPTEIAKGNTLFEYY